MLGEAEHEEGNPQTGKIAVLAELRIRYLPNINRKHYG
jgi:hypothetical protein